MSRRAAACFVALGSNMGDRSGHIGRALRAIERFCTVDSTASLYESAAAYVTDQPPFLNTVVAVRTELGPQELLRALKAVEAELGRVQRQRWGPREIDLDVLLHGDSVIAAVADEERGDLALDLPHPRLAERDFVLQPLAEIAPGAVHPILRRTFAQLAASLGGDPLPRVTPMPDGSLLRWGERTLLMGVLNTTPDSFSDGGEHASTDSAVRHAFAMAEAGADMIDVGAQSTRPGATEVSAAEEMARAGPVVRALREQGFTLPVSVDTYDASVAHELVSLGASVVNDVSGGARDPAMLPTVARLGVPAALMHMRGDPSSMQSLASYDDVVGEVRAELGLRLDAARAAGVPRWSLLADPGIGFAKTAEHNLAILASLHRFGRGPEGLGAPLLLGVSRKAFIGTLLGGMPPKERVWGTAGACAACVPHADLVRVHDVAEVKQAVTVADAIRRRRQAD